MILCHTKEFEIHKNNRNLNVFFLKAHYVKKTSSGQSFDCSMDFFKNVRKVFTPIRKAINTLDLSLYDQLYIYIYISYISPGISYVTISTSSVTMPLCCIFFAPLSLLRSIWSCFLIGNCKEVTPTP